MRTDIGGRQRGCYFSLHPLHRARQTRRHLGDVARAKADDHVAGAKVARRDARRKRRSERVGVGDDIRLPRSEEHTSELQSLMRISYAVICLKQKKFIDKPTFRDFTTLIT